MQKIKVVFARKKRKRGKGFTGIKETKYMQGGGTDLPNRLCLNVEKDLNKVL